MIRSPFSGLTWMKLLVRGLVMSGIYRRFLRSSCFLASFSLANLDTTLFLPSARSLGSKFGQLTMTVSQAGHQYAGLPASLFDYE
jgi:hypothetical protein